MKDEKCNTFFKMKRIGCFNIDCFAVLIILIELRGKWKDLLVLLNKIYLLLIFVCENAHLFLIWVPSGG